MWQTFLKTFCFSLCTWSQKKLIAKNVAYFFKNFLFTIYMESKIANGKKRNNFFHELIAEADSHTWKA